MTSFMNKVDHTENDIIIMYVLNDEGWVRWSWNFWESIIEDLREKEI